MDGIQMIRSRRKTISITVKPDGNVLVRAPENMQATAVRRFVEEHRDWIEKKQKLVEEHSEMRKTFEKKFVCGEKFLYLGREYALDLAAVPDKKRTKVEITENTLSVVTGASNEGTVGKFREETEAAVRKWYKEKAGTYIEERTAFYAGQMGVVYGQIRLKEQKTRWGSCSSRGNLNFNWKLIMAPPEILDYVIVHELCHLKEMNHSSRFWQAVGEVLPDYRMRRCWLKEHGAKLCL